MQYDFVSLGNKENYKYSVRGSRYGNLLYRTRPMMGLLVDGEICLGRLVMIL